jgi:hypothetical protein
MVELQHLKLNIEELCWVWWLTPVVLATVEAEIGKIAV